jgi:hypothetical protein
MTMVRIPLQATIVLLHSNEFYECKVVQNVANLCYKAFDTKMLQSINYKIILNITTAIFL